jgi:hypothetical protein
MNNLIKTPVRYDEESGLILEADRSNLLDLDFGLKDYLWGVPAGEKDERQRLVAEAIVTAINTLAAPVDMIIFCPKCHLQHVDEPNPTVCMDCGHKKTRHDFPDESDGRNFDICLEQGCQCTSFNPWTNPPHRKHRCQNPVCNHVFAVTATIKTNGVKELPT